MVRDDVRSLDRSYCEQGASVDYGEYPDKSHLQSFIPFATEGMRWLKGIDEGLTPGNNCSEMPAGNTLTIDRDIM